MLVETALVSTLLIIIAFGVLEFGLLIHQANQVADSVRAGARSGSATDVSGPFQDSDILSAMKTSSSGLGNGIYEVVIYKAASASADPPQACLQGVPVNGLCSVYKTADFAYISSGLSGRPGTQGWPPSQRVPGTDYVGVVARSKHDYMTKLFGVSHNLQDRGVGLLEKRPPAAAGTTDDGWDDGTTRTFVPTGAWNQISGDPGTPGTPPTGQVNF